MTWRWSVAAICSVTLLLGSASAAFADPTADPAANAQPSAAFASACQRSVTAGCDAAALADVAAARAADGVAPMTLPTDFDSLSAPMQLLVVSNLERVDRGLAPIAGLADSLDSLAQSGADNDEDPSFPNPFPGTYGGANWAGVGASTLLDDFYWMYDDGPGSANGDCTAAGQSGCWGHRHNILHDYDTPAVMGAAVNTSTPDGVSMATEFIGGDSKDTPDSAFLWSSVTPDLPVGLSQTSMTVPSGSSARLSVWASGEAMNVSLGVSSGASAWSLDTSGCQLAAGAECSVTVTNLPTAGATDGVLNVTGPNGTQTVALHAVDPPTAPTAVSVTPGSASVNATWAAPADQGSSPVTSYVATATPGGQSCVTTATSCVITGLANGTAYAVSVVARNAEGSSPASAAVTVTPVAPPDTVPGSGSATPGAPATAPGTGAPGKPAAAKPPGCQLTHLSTGRRLQKVTITCHGLAGAKAQLVLQVLRRGRWVTVRVSNLRLRDQAGTVTTRPTFARGDRVRDVLKLANQHQLALLGSRVS